MARLDVHLLSEPEPDARDVLFAGLDDGIACTFGTDRPEPAEYGCMVRMIPACGKQLGNTRIRLW